MHEKLLSSKKPNQLIMKKLLIISILSLGLISCGGSKSGKDIADEVCDCYKKANGMDATDPNRSAEQDKCLVKQRELWDKVKDDKEKSDEFNKRISECSSDLIKQSFGK
jgi:hypothetical protein